MSIIILATISTNQENK
ncbi:TPA: hypothetical protein ACG6FY_002905 [Escherichia coli]